MSDKQNIRLRVPFSSASLVTMLLLNSFFSSLQNSSPAPKPGAKGEQAVALRIAGDQAAFWGCGFYSNQDTLLDELNRHYFKECYIEGSIDFIFVDARSLYKVRFRAFFCPQRLVYYYGMLNACMYASRTAQSTVWLKPSQRGSSHSSLGP